MAKNTGWTFVVRYVPLAIAFALARSEGFIDPGSWWYPLVLLGCVACIVVIPFPVARWLDALSVVALLCGQVSLVRLGRLNEWHGVALQILVRFAVMGTCFESIRIVLGRGFRLLPSPGKRMNHTQDLFWSGRMGYAAGAAIGLLLVLVLAVLILLGAPIIALFDDSVYQVVGAFSWLVVVLFVSSWFANRSLMARRETRGYRQSIEYLSAYPESVIKAVVSAEQELIRQQTRMGIAVSGFCLGAMIMAREVLGPDVGRDVIVGGGCTLVLVILALVRHTTNEARRRWSGVVASRIDDRDLYEQVTRRSILRRPKGADSKHAHA